MSDLWYQKPSVLLQNYNQFFPNNNLTRIQKINSLARFSIYYTFFVLIFKKYIDTKWLSIGVIIILISLFLGTTEKFTNSESPNHCQKPTKQNPFMNYTLGDLMDNNNRPKACDYENVKNDIRDNFRSHIQTDLSDIWGRFISDRNYYTMPNTQIVNDQTEFAKWCFGNSGECKSFGTNCLKQRDPTYHRGRMTTVE